jgi:hypothetical protein
MMDTVVHHMRPTHSAHDLVANVPFNQTAHYWTDGILPNETFTDYAQHPAQALEPGCDPGECDRQEAMEHGWFFDLPALKIGGSSEVRQHLNAWIAHMVREYNISALRLDTAPYVPVDCARAACSSNGGAV